MKRIICACFCLILAACAPGSGPRTNPGGTWLSPSERAYLNIERPFPNYDDVCVLLGDSENTASLKADGQALIACPKHETGASADRRDNGARMVGESEWWIILSLPEDKMLEQLQTY